METRIVLAIGTSVLLGVEGDDDKFRGVVTGILAEEGRTLYRVAWWADRTHCEEYLAEAMVHLDGDASDDPKKMRIGFRTL